MGHLIYPKEFQRHEWKQDPDKVTQPLIDTMLDLRVASGKTMIIHEAVGPGHAPKSYHYVGEAADFHWSPGGVTYTQQLVLILSHINIGGVGFYPEWSPCPGWHIDLRQTGRKVLWIRQNGKYQYGYAALANAINMQTAKEFADKLHQRRA